MRCMFCNKKILDSKNARIIMTKSNKNYCCNQICEEEANKFIIFTKKYSKAYAIIIIIFICLIFIGTANNYSELNFISIASLGLLQIVLPFCTDQTIYVFGIKITKIMSRVVGVILITIGIGSFILKG